jgi:imidazole glycerol-phosphate synthase subunit HisH
MIAVIDYEAGNLTSVELALRHVGGKPVVTQDPEVVRAAGRVVFPGVGAAGHCMENLARLGLDEALRDAVAAGTPVLAICIGIQLLFERSEEDGGVECLGILPGRVRRFRFGPEGPKVPQIGWNAVSMRGAHPLFEDVEAGSEFYFVHSYYVEPADSSLVLGETDYGGVEFTSVVARDNLVATQFHPEKSGRAGLSVLKRFLA